MCIIEKKKQQRKITQIVNKSEEERKHKLKDLLSQRL